MKIDELGFTYNLIEAKDMCDCNFVSMPMKAGNYIKINNNGNYKKINIKKYQHLIGKLMYLSYRTRSNIFSIVGQLNKKNADPRIENLKAAKQII